MDLVCLWAPDPPLDLQRSNLPSLSVCLVGQARVCPLGKPGDDPGGAKEAAVQLLWSIHWLALESLGFFSSSRRRLCEGPRAGLVVRTGEHVGPNVALALCMLAPVPHPPDLPALLPEFVLSLPFCHWIFWLKLFPLWRRPFPQLFTKALP